MSGRLTKEEFVLRAQKIHGDKYDYSESVYINLNTKTRFKCKKENHGIFYKTSKQHLDGQGCPICDKANVFGQKFITEAKRIHKKYCYDYSLVNYTSRDKKVTIKCPNHGIFEQTPAAHSNGSKCPLCGQSKFNLKSPNSPAILYYIKVEYEGIVAYKIGITQCTTLDRFFSAFKRPLATITLLKEEHFQRGIDAFDKEQEIIKRYSYEKYTGINLLSVGNSEMFRSNVLGIYL